MARLDAWFDRGRRDDGPERVVDRVLTVPNVLSLLRLAALPFIYLDLVSGPDRHLRALVVLMIFAATDWLDGYVARRFDQVSRVGKLFDPISDRLLVTVVGIALIVADVVPLWVVVVLVARDVVVMAGGVALMRRGIPAPAVTRVGKTATFVLMTAFPLWILASVLGDGPSDPDRVTDAVAWSLFGIGTALYYYAAAQYASTSIAALRDLGGRQRG